MKRFLAAALIVAASIVYAPSPSQARELHQGDMVASLGGGFSSDSFSLGGMFGYFVISRVMVGAKYTFAWEGRTYLDADYTVKQHSLDAFGRFYVLTKGSIFPFVYAGAGYLNYGQKVDALQMDKSWDFFSLFAGVGSMFLFGDHFGLEGTIGYRKYVSVPGDIASFDDSQFEWNIGFGIYF